MPRVPLERADDGLPELPPGYLRGDHLLKLPDQPEALWGKGLEVLWARGEPLMIYGPQGCSKTTLAGNITRARLGFGGDLLGLPVAPLEEGKTILLLLMDRPRQAAIRLRQVLDGIPPQVLRRRVILRPGPESLCTADPGRLLALCREVNAADVIIDSVKDAVTGMSKEEPAQQWNSTVQQAVVAGVNVLALHHTRKAQVGNKQPNTIDDVYGNQFLYAGFGSIICLWADPGAPVLEFLHIKQPADACGPRRMWVSDRGRCEPYLEQDLADQVGPGGITAEDAARLWYGKTAAADIERARRKLDRLTREGLLCEVAGTRGRGGNKSRWHLAQANCSDETAGQENLGRDSDDSRE